MKGSGKSPGTSQAQPCQRIPVGQFNSDGQSQGKATGAVRKSPDAVQGPRGGQSK